MDCILTNLSEILSAVIDEILSSCREDFKIRKECAIKVRMDRPIKTGMNQKTGQWSRTIGLAVGSGAWRR